MNRTPIRRVSKKQRARKAAWAKVTKQRIADVGGICEVGWRYCQRNATAGHHKLPRRFRNDSYANCLATCNECHGAIHRQPEAAKAAGFILTDPSQMEAK